MAPDFTLLGAEALYDLVDLMIETYPCPGDLSMFIILALSCPRAGERSFIMRILGMYMGSVDHLGSAKETQAFINEARAFWTVVDAAKIPETEKPADCPYEKMCGFKFMERFQHLILRYDCDKVVSFFERNELREPRRMIGDLWNKHVEYRAHKVLDEIYRQVRMGCEQTPHLHMKGLVAPGTWIVDAHLFKTHGKNIDTWGKNLVYEMTQSMVNDNLDRCCVKDFFKGMQQAKKVESLRPVIHKFTGSELARMFGYMENVYFWDHLVTRIECGGKKVGMTDPISREMFVAILNIHTKDKRPDIFHFIVEERLKNPSSTPIEQMVRLANMVYETERRHTLYRGMVPDNLKGIFDVAEILMRQIGELVARTNHDLGSGKVAKLLHVDKGQWFIFVSYLRNLAFRYSFLLDGDNSIYTHLTPELLAEKKKEAPKRAREEEVVNIEI